MDQSASRSSCTSVLTCFAQILALAALYVVLGLAGQEVSVLPGSITAIWVPAGVAFLGVYYLGKRVLPGVWLGGACLTTSNTLAAGVGVEFWDAFFPGSCVGMGAALQALVGVCLVRRFAAARFGLDGEVVRLLLFAGPVACIVNATIGTATLLSFGIIPFAAVPFTWTTWWAGDAVGVLLLAPAIRIGGKGGVRLALRVVAPGFSVILVAIFVLSDAYRDSKSEAEIDFERRARTVARVIEQDMSAFVETLHSLSSFYAGSTDVTRADFSTFVEHPLARHPAIRALVWAPRVEPQGAQIHATFPVTYSEPTTLMGFDLTSNPGSRRAMEEARDAADVRSTSHVSREPGDGVSGTWLFMPLYGHGAGIASVAERTEALVGYYAVLADIQRVIRDGNEAMGGAGLTLDFRESSAGSNVHSDDEGDVYLERVDMAGGHWDMRFQRVDEAQKVSEFTLGALLVTGLLFTMIMQAFLMLMNQHAARIESVVDERTSQLNDANEALQREVRERAQIAMMLEVAKRVAEAASRSKSAFLANMSHEIRTPMTAILGYADLLEDEVGSSELRSEYIATIRDNGEYLLTIINDILDLSKIEADKMECEKIDCSLIEIVDGVRRLSAARAEEKGLVLAVDYETPLPTSIRSDPVRLRQILINLVGNAVKFTNEGSVRLAVRLVATDGAERIEIAVRDTGIGIPADKIPELFDSFAQADVSTTREFGGTGLGLTISKRLAGIMGGDIAVRSEIGRGSTFTLIVDPGPLRGVATVDAAPGSPAPALPERDPGDTRLAGSVLVAEDNPVNRRLVRKLLERVGLDVTEAENGDIACRRILEAGGAFDLVLMDMQMPVLDGYAATARLRAAGFTAPVIALTANAMADDEERCRAAGCDAFLSKPIDRAEFHATLAGFLARPNAA